VTALATLTWPLSLGAQSLDPARGGPAVDRSTVVFASANVEPDLLNPLLEPDTLTAFYDIIPVLFTIDVQRDAAWRPFPQGVQYLPSVADGTWKLDGEKMTLVWKLKPRNWHDGRTVTCADYVFSHRVTRDQQIAPLVSGMSPHVREVIDRITNVSCPNGASGVEVAVTWKERHAYANLTVIGQLARLPRHLLEPFYRSNPAKLGQIPYGTDPRTTVGDGAYRLVEWQRRVSLTVEAVANHPIFGTPKIKRIIWRFTPPTNTWRESIASGTIDAIQLLFDRALELERQGQDRFKVLLSPAVEFEHIGFRLENPLLQDLRVRRAIAHGINRTQIVQQLFAGRQPVAHSYLAPQHPGYTDNVQKYSYDPARARALLREAGFSPGPDGIMRDATGRRLTLEINTTENPIREQVELIIQQQLRQVGIEITILNYPRRIFFGLLERRQLKALWMVARSLEATRGCVFPPGYQNPEWDRVCGAITREIDETKRNMLLSESARIFSRDLPALPLYFRVRAAAAKTGLRNFTRDRPRGCVRNLERPSVVLAMMWLVISDW
jgi:peptide/nickel transport system substrate-binding protein